MLIVHISDFVYGDMDKNSFTIRHFMQLGMVPSEFATNIAHIY